MALGTSSPLFATLASWQKVDLRDAIARLASPSAEDGKAAAIVPQNLVPHIRAAVAAQISSPADAISVDVIGLLFDYIFRDPTIPESTRTLFGRLQVPIVKAALLDRAFDARLTWVSPLRAKYIFTSRSRSHAFILTPEELAWQLGSGTARLVAEPVPLWDRAVSSALDLLAARAPAGRAGPATHSPVPA